LVFGALALTACKKIHSCEFDKVRAEVLDYEHQMSRLVKEERALKRRMVEFHNKVYTNQKAGVDLLKAVLVRATKHYAQRFAALPVRSRLLKPYHRKKARALKTLAQVYAKLVVAYPKADIPTIRTEEARLEKAMRAMAAAELRLTRLIRRYKSRRRR
jgi:hypothetical protein